MIVQFTVLGKIRGKARPRVTRNGVYTPKETKEYEELIRLAYKCAAKGQNFVDDAVCVHIFALFEIPKRFNKAERKAAESGIIYPTKKPDCDNIAKVVCDALNGVAWDDDKRVVKLIVDKMWATEKEKINVWIEEVKQE